MVQACVEAQLVDRVAALFRSARNADHARAFDLADLANDGADGTGRSSDNQRLSRLRPPGMRSTPAPLSFRIWTKAKPTAPVATATTSGAPGCGRPISLRPT